MNAAPKRRWSFSLRTLFAVLTVFAIWLGWELNDIRQRRAMRNRVVDSGGVIVLGSDQREIAQGIVQIPFWRRWLGDDAVGMVLLECDATPADVERAKATFPEVLYCEAVRSRVEAIRRPPRNHYEDIP